MSVKKNNYNGPVEEREFLRNTSTNLDITYPTEEDLQRESEQWAELEGQNPAEYYPEPAPSTLNSNVLDKFAESSNFVDDPFSTPEPSRIDLDDDWEEDAWLERWRMNPEKYLVTALPPELSSRLEEAVRERKMKRSEFVLKALEVACKSVELDKLRRKGLAEGDPAKLIKDPQTGKYRCFPAEYFTEEELYGFEVVDGKYYQKRWEKTNQGWVQVNKGYFEALNDQESPYIKMVNNKPTGSWEVYPFEFFEHDWKWGIYDHDSAVIEVKGRKENDGVLWLDIYIDDELVNSVTTSREVHRIIMEYIG
ncbi:CopG family transcriptional regulator [Hazenella coriacea]|uniref:Uncharacterized protein n=1 Tax=Hazenella coriacea TaxID=1179467 RepID=A0A4R3L7B4_9BACL|nr:CopG family transcriptional regulator [Hazenella coriacea]TCS95831.1 hypothetical protein EDD58_102413 [Hazenella coriacea]